MYSYVVTANRNRQIEHVLAWKDGAEKVEFDFNPWVDDHETVTAVTWTVKSGQAAVSGEALASNVASALITTAEQGASLIQIVATAGSNKYVTHILVKAKDPELPSQDYGLCVG
jgi:hypothetical protein